MIDKTHIIIKVGHDCDKTSLDRYGKIISELPQISLVYLRVYSFVDSGAALSAIKALPGVIYAEYNQKFSAEKDSPWLYEVSPTSRAANNRALYEVIRAPQAWDITTGHPDIVICHLDTGIQQSHPNLRVVYGGTSQEGILDLSPANNVNRVDVDAMAGEAVGLRPGTAVTLRVYQYDHLRDVSGTGVGPWVFKSIYSDAALTVPLSNPYELTGISGLVFYMDGQADVFIDIDDGSEYGYTTWSFGGIGDTSCFDAVGHGTATSSLINGQHDTPGGVYGIAPGCTLVHFRMSDAMGGGNNMDSVNLIVAAADYPNCKVISNSWGVADPASPSSLALHDAINYAIAKDIIVGFSAGNSGSHANSSLPDPYIYPAAWDEVLSVSGTGNPKTNRTITRFIADTDDFDYFTVNEKVTRNDKVFISAPMAQVAVACPETSNIYWDQLASGHGPPSHARRYTTLLFGGTSCAMPIVAGVIGLMYSAAREQGITLTASTAKAYLAGSATGGIKLLNGSASTYSGAGLVNAYAAVQSVIAGVTVTSPAVQTEPKLRLTKNITDASRQIVLTIPSGVVPQQITVTVDGTLTNTIVTPVVGANTVTLPDMAIGLHEMIATLTHSTGTYTISEPVAVNPVAGVVYALPLTSVGGGLRWSIAGVAPVGHTIKDLSVSFGGKLVEVFTKGNTLISTSSNGGIRTGVIDPSTYPAGELTYAASLTAYNNSTNAAYAFTPVSVTHNNTIGYLSASPEITEFTAPPASFPVIPVNFTSSDDVAVTGYLITLSPLIPSLSDLGWSSVAPATYTVAGTGVYVLYAWTKDADDNISGPYAVRVDVQPPPPPSATPASGRYQEGQTVVLFDPLNRLILYTADGSDPRSYIVTNDGIAQFVNGVLQTTGEVN